MYHFTRLLPLRANHSPQIEEGDTTVATKHGKRSGAKTGTAKGKKAAASRAAKARRGDADRRPQGDGPRGSVAPARRAAKPRPPAPRRAPAAAPRPASGSSLLERARALRDAIQRSKLTASNPWAYTPKARGWEQRAQQLLEQLARGGPDGATRQALDALATEVERDPDFREARRLF